MKFPKLKYPRFCRMLPYVVVIGCGLLPIFAVFLFPFPDLVRVVVVLGSLLGLLAYMIKNFIVLMSMDMALATLSCYRTARKQYTLPSGRPAEVIRQSVLRYGTHCDPKPIQPQPCALRYKFSSPMTVYSSGIERVIAAYEVDLLDGDTYSRIFSSAKTNSNALAGKKKALFLDAAQKKEALHRVTVVLILAHRVDSRLLSNLYERVCQQCGDEDENCFLPCVVDLEHHTCVFNSLRVPYVGFGYAVKNRGIRIIKRCVFGGNLNLTNNTHFLEQAQAPDPETSLWEFWKELRHQFVGADKQTKRQFETMSEKEIRVIDEELYLKWDQRGICQAVKLDTENKIAKVEAVTDWYYPKMQPIGKKIIQNIKEQITSYYAKQGYTVEFVDLEALI